MKKATVKKSINITSNLEKRINDIISKYPGYNFTLIVNLALEEWLRGPQETNVSIPSFIHDKSKGFGPQAKR